MRSSFLAKEIADLTLTKKANDVVIMDLRKVSPVADFFVLCSSDSDIQTRAIAGAVEAGMEQRGQPPWHKETDSPNWIVLDFVDVVLHIFHKNTRSYYNLEKLWGDAKISRLADASRPGARTRRKPIPRQKTKRRLKGRRKAAS